MQFGDVVRSQLVGVQLSVKRLGALVLVLDTLIASDLGPSLPLSAQQVVRTISSGPTCRKCRIEARWVAKLATDTEPGLLAAWPMSIARDSRGNFLVATSAPRDAGPLVFAPSGRFVARIGRAGSGPGEYRSARSIYRGRGDSLVVVDPHQPRLSILSPSGTFVRGFPIPVTSAAALVLEAGDVVVNAPVNDADRVGLPLHTFAAAGAYLRSFGEAGASEVPWGFPTWLRLMTEAQDGTVWVAEVFRRYRLTQWSRGGDLLHTVEVTPSWFPPYRRKENLRRDRPPQPQLVGLWMDASQRLWVVGWVADRDYSSGFGPLVGVEGSLASEVTNTDRAFDTMVDVLDLRRGLLLARTRLDKAFTLAAGGGLVAHVDEGTNGYEVEIWGLSLRGEPIER